MDNFKNSNSEDTEITPTLHYKKSSYCAAAGCVEVAYNGESVFMRNSTNPGQAPIKFSKAEWSVFIQGIKEDEFEIKD